mgnify:CR=1 FL=1
MSYSADDDLDLLFHGITTTPGYAAGEANFSKERELAYAWVNDQLRDRYTVPFTSPSKTVILAEASYTVGLILRSKATTAGYEFSTYNPFFQEAKSNISKLRTMRTGPDASLDKNTILSTSTGVEPAARKSQVDAWGQRLDLSVPRKRLDFF